MLPGYPIPSTDSSSFFFSYSDILRLLHTFVLFAAHQTHPTITYIVGYVYVLYIHPHMHGMPLLYHHHCWLYSGKPPLNPGEKKLLHATFPCKPWSATFPFNFHGLVSRNSKGNPPHFMGKYRETPLVFIIGYGGN